MKVFILILLMLSCYSCKEIPPGPIDPGMMNGDIEILYERVYEVVDSRKVPSVAMIRHYEYPGKNSSQFVPAGENKWLAEVYIAAHPQPYTISVADSALSWGPVGRKISLRLKDNSNWVELTCIVPGPAGPAGQGESAKFVFYMGQIQNPTRCE